MCQVGACLELPTSCPSQRPTAPAEHAGLHAVVSQEPAGGCGVAAHANRAIILSWHHSNAGWRSVFLRSLEHACAPLTERGRRRPRAQGPAEAGGHRHAELARRVPGLLDHARRAHRRLHGFRPRALVLRPAPRGPVQARAQHPPDALSQCSPRLPAPSRLHALAAHGCHMQPTCAHGRPLLTAAPSAGVGHTWTGRCRQAPHASGARSPWVAQPLNDIPSLC